MSNAWSKFLTSSRQQHRLARAISSGELNLAAEFALQNRMDQTIGGRRALKRLTTALVVRASENTSCGNLASAWNDLSTASQVALPPDQDQLSKQKSELVELTVETADSLLNEGKIAYALRLVEELRRRKILDWRADRIEKTAQLIRAADDCSARGDLSKAAVKLSEARNLRPDLAFIRMRQSAIEQRLPQLRWLKDKLQFALVSENWDQVQSCCEKLLTIAPNYQVARDAQRRLAQEQRRLHTSIVPHNIRGNEIRQSGRTTSQDRAAEIVSLASDAHEEWGHKNVNLNCIPAPVADSEPKTQTAAPHQSAEPIKDAMESTSNPANSHNPSGNSDTETVHVGCSTVGNQPNAAEELNLEPAFIERPFMIWVDGVGGFRVCPGETNIVGQAHDESPATIPMLGDLAQQHVSIKTLKDCHVIDASQADQFLIDGRRVDGPFLLKNGQEIQFPGGIKLKYEQAHPLSRSAKLTFSSRHRTQPWSDGVLLPNQPLILGPNSRNHVVCPHWQKDLLIFRRNNQWFARTEGKLEIDGTAYDNEGPLTLNSRIVGDEISLSLEEIK